MFLYLAFESLDHRGQNHILLSGFRCFNDEVHIVTELLPPAHTHTHYTLNARSLWSALNRIRHTHKRVSNRTGRAARLMALPFPITQIRHLACVIKLSSAGAVRRLWVSLLCRDYENESPKLKGLVCSKFRWEEGDILRHSCKNI